MGKVKKIVKVTMEIDINDENVRKAFWCALTICNHKHHDSLEIREQGNTFVGLTAFNVLGEMVNDIEQELWESKNKIENNV